MTLNAHDGLFVVGDRLSLCDLTDHAFTALESNDGRCGSGAFGVGDNSRFAAFINGNARVGCAKVNTDNFSHNINSSVKFEFYIIII